MFWGARASSVSCASPPWLSLWLLWLLHEAHAAYNVRDATHTNDGGDWPDTTWYLPCAFFSGPSTMSLNTLKWRSTVFHVTHQAARTAGRGGARRLLVGGGTTKCGEVRRSGLGESSVRCTCAGRQHAPCTWQREKQVRARPVAAREEFR